MKTSGRIMLYKAVLMLSGFACVALLIGISRGELILGAIMAAALAAALIRLKSTKADIKPRHVAAALITALVPCMSFYRRWFYSGTVLRLSRLLGLENGTFAILLTAAAVVCALPALSFAAARLDGLEIKLFKNKKAVFSAKKAFLLLLMIMLVALIPLLRADVNYIDDLGRVHIGNDSWGEFSRHVSNLLSHIVHADAYLYDVSPLTQLLAVAFMALAGLIVIRQLRAKADFSLWDLLAVIPLALVPYFLECFSYKYDAPYMALSVLVSVAPLELREKRTGLYFAAVTAAMLAMCMSYQAASGIFPMLVLLIAFKMWLNCEDTKKICRFVAVSALGYIIALAVFMLFIMKPVDDYVKNGIATLPEILSHYAEYLKVLASDFKPIWLLLIVGLGLSFVVSSAAEGKRKPAVSAAVSVLAVFLMLLLAFGLYPMLTQPTYFPRSMFGVGCFIVCMALGSAGEGRARRLSNALSAVLCWMFICFSCAYGNALGAQCDYTQFRTEELIEALTEQPEFNTEGEKLIQLEGSIGFCPIVDEMPKSYAIMRRLVPVQLCSDWYWGSYELMYYYGLDKNAVYNFDEDLVRDESWQSLDESFYHSIYYKDNAFIIELK